MHVRVAVLRHQPLSNRKWHELVVLALEPVLTVVFPEIAEILLYRRPEGVPRHTLEALQLDRPK